MPLPLSVCRLETADEVKCGKIKFGVLIVVLHLIFATYACEQSQT